PPPPPAIPRGELFAAPNLKSLLSNLYKKHKICSVLVEGGAAVNTSFLKSGLIDEWLLFIAPKILGKNALPVFHGNAPKKFQNAQIQSAQKIGKDILLKIALINV
ncbi:MAG: dihydrofolate reductase family protein, partial [Firmicutes bacterium]|nr:dihydrofolate reductase family protein [Bacillota bacterium]